MSSGMPATSKQRHSANVARATFPVSSRGQQQLGARRSVWDSRDVSRFVVTCREGARLSNSSVWQAIRHPATLPIL